MSNVFAIAKMNDFDAVKNQIEQRWTELEKNSNAFRYKLNVQKQKILDGNLNFLVQVKFKCVCQQKTCFFPHYFLNCSYVCFYH